MKLLVGLLLVATAFAYPLGEAEENKPGEPLVISDSYSSVSKSEDKVEKSVQQDSAELSEETSSEQSIELKPSEPPRAAETEQPALDSIRIDEEKSEPIAESTTLAEALLKEAAKPEESLPTLKKIETEVVVPQVKALPETEEKPNQEKPLALPALDKFEEKSVAASEIKEEIALPSEQKVEAPAAVEESLPALKSIIPEKEVAAEPVVEKKAKSDDPKLEESTARQEDASTQQQPTEQPAEPAAADEISHEEPQRIADQVAIDAKPIVDEKLPEGKSADKVVVATPVAQSVEAAVSQDQQQQQPHEEEKIEQQPKSVLPVDIAEKSS